MAAASLAGKKRKNVLFETSASAARSSTVMLPNPFSVNSRSAASASARRVRSFFRSRSGRDRSPPEVTMPGILSENRTWQRIAPSSF